MIREGLATAWWLAGNLWVWAAALLWAPWRVSRAAGRAFDKAWPRERKEE